eukprot:scaffold14139_cov74-Cyclotella_meneghiniana.AAC.6
MMLNTSSSLEDAIMKQKVFRPTLDDVERLSLGKGARKRGTGSRHIPHRLNQDERQELHIDVRGEAVHCAIHSVRDVMR